ncbi:MAG: hypothetical protein H6907_06210 [Hyphomicrobiales bacterium]|nr:hypothetical protein [Hyphomicrobiales bacterium]MCP5371311.1 hypothetical protein [Hyphomicrobiales bacterium]
MELVVLVPYLIAGAALGAVYFLLLLRVARGLACRAGLTAMIPLSLGRIALAAVVFWAIAQAGAGPLLAALAGFLAARAWVRHRAEAA